MTDRATDHMTYRATDRVTGRRIPGVIISLK
jgi:hypothetical protein